MMTIAAVCLSVRLSGRGEGKGVLHAPKSHQEELQVGKIRIRHGPSPDPNRKFNMVARCRNGTALKTPLCPSCAQTCSCLQIRTHPTCETSDLGRRPTRARCINLRTCPPRKLTSQTTNPSLPSFPFSTSEPVSLIMQIGNLTKKELWHHHP